MPFRLNSISILFFLVSVVHCAAAPVLAAESPGATSAETTAEPPAPGAKQLRVATQEERLDAILQSIKAAKVERADLIRQLKAAPTEAERKELQEDFERLTRRLEELNTSFEELATGGTSIAALEEDIERNPVDWKQEIEVIVRPLLQEVKRMTERPRAIERLRSEKTVYGDRLEVAEKAIIRIDEALAQTESDALKDVLTELKQDWKSHRADAESRLQLVNGQLERLLAPEQGDGQEIVAGLREFFSGRGLSALLAVAGFVVTYFLLASSAGLIGRLFLRRRETKSRRLAKVGEILFRVFSLLIAILAAMAVLYVRGDWLILGLLILFLFAVVFEGAAAEQYWSIRRFLQRTAVDGCNHYGWIIPFDQLTLHFPERDIPSREAGIEAPA